MNQWDEFGIYAQIGFCLVMLQSVEQEFKFITTWVIRSDEITLDKLNQLRAAERKKTLGYFIKNSRVRRGCFQNLRR